MDIVSAYVISAVTVIVMLIVASVVSNMISFRPDNSDCKSRKIWFWILGFLTPAVSFLIAFAFVYVDIKARSKASSYMIAMAISSIVSFIVYLIGGFVISKIDKHGKLGNWF